MSYTEGFHTHRSFTGNSDATRSITFPDFLCTTGMPIPDLIDIIINLLELVAEFGLVT